MGPIVILCGTHMLRRSDTRKAEMHSERMLCLNLELLRKHASLTHFFAEKNATLNHIIFLNIRNFHALFKSEKKNMSTS